MSINEEYSLLAKMFVQVVDNCIGPLGARHPEMYEDVVTMYEKCNKSEVLTDAGMLEQMAISLGQIKSDYQHLWHCVENGKVDDEFFELRAAFRRNIQHAGSIKEKS